MSEFIYYIHYRPGYKMAELDGLSSSLGEQRSEMDAYSFDNGQLMYLKNNDIGEAEETADVGLKEIDVAT